MSKKTNKEYGILSSVDAQDNFSSLTNGSAQTNNTSMSSANMNVNNQNVSTTGNEQFTNANTVNSTAGLSDSALMFSQVNNNPRKTDTSQKNMQTNNNKNQQTVVALFGSVNSAENAIRQLRDQGFSQEEISIISKRDQKENDRMYNDDVTDGTLTGGTIGGVGGLLLGAGALAIPGIGPIVAAGPIAAALGGAVAGGIAGGLVDWGIPSEDSQRYEENIAQGDVLAMIRTTANKAQQVIQILRSSGANEVKAH